MSDKRKCKNCGKLLKRWRRNGKLEPKRDFDNRKFCNSSCARKFQITNEPPKESDGIKEAAEKAQSGTKKEKLTAIEYLSQLVNDESQDAITRMNAAKALAPYESKKAAEKPSKGEEREKKAKKASTGRFSAGKAPVQRVK